MVEITTKRVYDPPDNQDGTRILVDKIWPRGISQENLAADDWNKALAPSTELRQWFAHDPDKWNEFRKRYLSELKDRKPLAKKLLSDTGSRRLTLLYAARDRRHNHALVLKEYLQKLSSSCIPGGRRGQ